MDTRDKILTPEAAHRLPPGRVTLVTGYFDALHAAHLADLAPLTRPVLAAVLPLEGALLPQRARAEMVAALRMIDYVLTPNEGDMDALIERLAPRELVRLEAIHTTRVRQLVEHVHRRHLQ